MWQAAAAVGGEGMQVQGREPTIATLACRLWVGVLEGIACVYDNPCPRRQAGPQPPGGPQDPDAAPRDSLIIPERVAIAVIAAGRGRSTGCVVLIEGVEAAHPQP